MDKKAVSERDIFCTKFITLALEPAGWDIHGQGRAALSLNAGRLW